MAVLMTYRKLVERDEKNVSKAWKYSAILLLVCAVLSCGICSISLTNLLRAFDDHCYLNARLNFEPKKEPSKNESLPSRMLISDFFPEHYSDNTTFVYRDSKYYPTEQLQFMDEYSINAHFTDWGKLSTCEYAIFIPIGQLCFSCMVLLMFILHGRGGRPDPSNQAQLAWPIVFPSMIFFIVMLIFSSVNLSNILKGFTTFCSGFKKNMSEIGCMTALNHFRIRTEMTVAPGYFYVLAITFSWLALVFFLSLMLLMITRILFAVDFRLVKVAVKTIEYQSDEKIERNFSEEDIGNADENNSTVAPLASEES